MANPEIYIQTVCLPHIATLFQDLFLVFISDYFFPFQFIHGPQYTFLHLNAQFFNTHTNWLAC